MTILVWTVESLAFFTAGSLVLFLGVLEHILTNYVLSVQWQDIDSALILLLHLW